MSNRIVRSCRHVGDLGNVQEDSEGEVSVTITDSYMSLYGDYSVLNRAIVVRVDDF